MARSSGDAPRYVGGPLDGQQCRPARGHYVDRATRSGYVLDGDTGRYFYLGVLCDCGALTACWPDGSSPGQCGLCGEDLQALPGSEAA